MSFDIVVLRKARLNTIEELKYYSYFIVDNNFSKLAVSSCVNQGKGVNTSNTYLKFIKPIDSKIEYIILSTVIIYGEYNITKQ